MVKGITDVEKYDTIAESYTWAEAMVVVFTGFLGKTAMRFNVDTRDSERRCLG